MEHLDVIVVGAGLSGIAAGYHLQASCPGKTYAILEARDALGGTWDLFRYPGIRSDSDMFTLGFSFRPWKNPQAIADGPSILAYLRETAEEHGIDRKIRYAHRVEHASWSSADARWTVRTRDAHTGEVRELSCSFLFMCSGYYDYDEGYTPELPGRERFRGRIVHPQKWTADVDYADKRVVVIGSGATAVTLVPELAKKAAHVTMLQRSPTYVMSLPGRDPIAALLNERLPARAAYEITRWKNVAIGLGVYQFCRRFPERAKKILVGQVKKHLGDSPEVTENFTPHYAPWDQRLCFVPDDDLFDAIKRGAASVVTDRIETFTETGIRLRSGREIDADVIVTATGLQVKFMGGMTAEVDGKRLEPAERLVYKGLMLDGVPNLAFAIGYTNASWTLKCELACAYVCRLVNHMSEHGYAWCSPRRDATVGQEPLIDFSSGYVQRALDRLPKQGSKAPWKLYQNYALDRVAFRHGKLDDGAMMFGR